MTATQSARAIRPAAKCPGCDKRFTSTPGMATVEIDGQEKYTRYGSSGLATFSGYRSRKVLWHSACLTAFEDQNEAYRQQVAAERDAALIEYLMKATGRTRGEAEEFLATALADA